MKYSIAGFLGVFLLLGWSAIYAETNQVTEKKPIQLYPDDTLSSGKRSTRWLAEVQADFTDIGGNLGIFLGGKAHVVIGDGLLLGAGGGFLANSVRLPQLVDGIPAFLGIGYGGITLGAMFPTDSRVRCYLDCLVGAGGLSSTLSDPDQTSNGGGQIGGRFLFAPEAGMDINLGRGLSIGVSIKYLLFAGNETYLGLSSPDLSGLSASVVIRCGSIGE